METSSSGSEVGARITGGGGGGGGGQFELESELQRAEAGRTGLWEKGFLSLGDNVSR
jgi:hypothetical protein